MKKSVSILVALITAAVILVGCNSSNDRKREIFDSADSKTKQQANLEEQEDKREEKQNSSLKQYSGAWISTDFKMIKLDGYEAPYGTQLTLNFLEENIAEIFLYDISMPPANRIASIETKLEFSQEGGGVFYFDSDGWGTTGKGTIKLMNDQIVVLIDYEQNDNKDTPDWRIFSGEKSFIRD